MGSLILIDPLRLSAVSGHCQPRHLWSSSAPHVTALSTSFGAAASRSCRLGVSFVAGARRLDAVMPSPFLGCIIFDNLGSFIFFDEHFIDLHQTRGKVYKVGDFMTQKKHLVTVKPTTTVDDALETFAKYKFSGFPVIDDNWKLIGVLADYDLLAVNSVSGTGQPDISLFPEVDSSWKIFNEIQKLLCKSNGKTVADVMTPSPLVIHENATLEDAARWFLKTKHRRLPVVDDAGNLVGIITRGAVVRAAFQIKCLEQSR